MGVQVADIARCQSRIGQSKSHRPAHTFAIRRRLDHVVGVVGGGVPGHFGQDRGAALFRVLESLEHEHRRSLAEHESVTVGVESAPIAPNPATLKRVTGASAPPAYITSTTPRRIISTLSPIAWADDAHA